MATAIATARRCRSCSAAASFRDCSASFVVAAPSLRRDRVSPAYRIGDVSAYINVIKPPSVMKRRVEPTPAISRTVCSSGVIARPYNGMLPCFLGIAAVCLSLRKSRAATTRARVSRG